MKRKILLLTIMLALFACIFAITSSAADIPEWTDVITYETGENAIAYKDGFDTTSRVLLSNGDGTYSTYPSNYIIKGTDAVFSNNEIDFTALKKASGKNYTNASIIRFEMPVGFTSVQESTFRTDKGLQVTSMLTVKIAEGVESFGKYVFYQQNVLEEIELPSTLATLPSDGTMAYRSTSIRKINIPKSLKAIPKQTFYENSALTEVDFSQATSLESIGESAFIRCEALDEIILPEGLLSISKYAFRETGMKTLVIPSTVTSFGDDSFYQNTSLKNVTVKLENIPSKLFYNCYAIENLQLENTKEIGDRAFLINVSDVTPKKFDVYLPEGLTTIKERAFYQSGARYVYLPSSIETIEKEAFYASAIENVESYSPIIGEYMFHKCANLKKITLVDTVSIGTYAFLTAESNGVTELILPDTLKKIGGSAFGRTSITTLVVPASVEEVESGAFKESKSLEKAVVLGKVMGTKMFEKCSSMTELVVAEKLKSFDSTALNEVSTTKFTTYYTGENGAEIKELMKGSSRISGARLCTYADNKENLYTDKYLFIYGCNLCDVAFGGNHTVDEKTSNGCADICKYCALATPKENPQHNIDTTYAYPNGYATAGTMTYGCVNEGCPLKKEASVTEIPAIFEGFMYATRQSQSSDSCGMVMTYLINREALEIYEAETGEIVSYGVFAVAKHNLVNNAPLNQDGTVASEAVKVVSANLTAQGLNNVDLIIWGSSSAWNAVINEELQLTAKDVEFYLLGFTVDSSGLNYFCGESSSSDLTALKTMTYKSATVS